MEGYAPGEYRPSDLSSLMQRRMTAVAEIYRRIVYQQQGRSHSDAPDAPFELRSTLDPGTVDRSTSKSWSDWP